MIVGLLIGTLITVLLGLYIYALSPTFGSTATMTTHRASSERPGSWPMLDF